MTDSVDKKTRTLITAKLRAGYTLIETLIMLAIISMISVLLLEAIRGATSSGIRIERVASRSIGQHLDMFSLRTVIAGATVQYLGLDDVMVGSGDAFSGRTSTPIGLSGLHDTTFAVRLQTVDRETRLIYSEGDSEWVVKAWQDAAGAFLYLDVGPSWDPESERRWVSSWPQEFPADYHYSPNPRAIKLSIVSDGKNEAYVFALPNTATPVIRASDLFGGGRQ